ncbi:MAG: hypothetical protein HYT15_04470 [Candidatus Magasanikbacteria bacterium]|nr:hypothetical protein [Candidatus Magasanikbacteria bacterium]
MATAQVEFGLSQAWTNWVNEHKGSYQNPYIHTRCRDKAAEILVLLTYYGGAGRKPTFFRDGWTQEKEDHFRDLMERYMEKVFSGFDFYLTFNSEGSRWVNAEEARLILAVGYNGPASFATDKYLYLIYPAIVGHEAAHLCPQPYDQNGWCMGYDHHYCNDEIDNHERCAPPGEFEVGCIMHRNALTFGPMEQKISGLDYPFSPEARQALEDEIEGIGLEIKTMLPEEMVARGEAELEAPLNHGLELTPQQRQDHIAHKQLLQNGQYWLSGE